MRNLKPLFLGLAIAFVAGRAPVRAQEELASVATLRLADGSAVALVEWKLTYEFGAWRQGEPISSAKPQTRQAAGLILGKKTYPVKGETLTLTHVETEDGVRVAVFNLKKAGDIKMENPARETLAPDLDKKFIYQPRSLDVSGKTLSGIQRSFCIASFSALVDCGGTKTTRVVKIDFN